MIGSRSPILCWDLDDTLGCFDDLSQVLVRRDVPSVLARLTALGWTHYLTTSSSSTRAEAALQAARLRSFFSGVFGGDQIVHGLHKKYLPVAEALGLSPEEAKTRMVAIGDSSIDVPMDLAVVAILDREYLNESSEFLTHPRAVERILRELLERGKGNFSSGFLNLYESSPDGPGSRQAELDGIRFSLKQQISGEILVPVVYGITGSRYQSALAPVAI
jgi:hypothetical protein